MTPQTPATTTTTTTPATTAKTELQLKVDSTRALLMSMKGEIEKALPRHVRAETMLRVVMNEVQMNPKLLKCTKDSFLKSVMQASQIGLIPDGVSGLAHLVPYENKKANNVQCKLIIGYRGLLQLARRSNEMSGIFARCVYAKDTFHYCYGMAPKLEHIETQDAEPGEIVFAYAIAFLKDGGMPMFEVMSKRQIEKIRDGVAYKDPKGPWYADPDPMYRKTALRKLCKLLPFSTELNRAVTIDELNERNLPVPTIVDFPQEPATTNGPATNGSPSTQDATQQAGTTATAPKSGSGKLEQFSGKVESADGLRKAILAALTKLGFKKAEDANLRLLDLSTRDDGPYKNMAFDVDNLNKVKSVGLLKEVLGVLENDVKQRAAATEAQPENATLSFDGEGEGGDPGPDDNDAFAS